MSKFLTAPKWYDAGGGLNESLDVNCNGYDTATAFGKGAKANLVGTAIGSESDSPNGVSVGYQASSTNPLGLSSVAIGNNAKANFSGDECIAIGATARCVQSSKPSRKIQFLSRDSISTTSMIGFGRDSLLDLIYPISTIYISTALINPSEIFGGTWEAFATGRTLVGVDANDTDFVENITVYMWKRTA
mgnify:FL=1